MGMTSTSRPPPTWARDGQLRSAFTPILENLCGSCSGSLAAAIADDEGECVDFSVLPVVSQAGVLPSLPVDTVKICAAHWQIVMSQLLSSASLAAKESGSRQLWIEADGYGFVVQHLHARYVLVLVCRPRALSTVSWRALRQCEVELAIEARWPVRDGEKPCWTRTRAKLDKNGRPFAVWFGHAWLADLVVEEPSRSRARAGDGFERRYYLRSRSGVSSAQRSVDEDSVGVARARGEKPQLRGGSDAFELVREPTGLWYLGCSLSAMQTARARGAPSPR
jgi:hypothetical protein